MKGYDKFCHTPFCLLSANKSEFCFSYSQGHRYAR